jgi:hypothetical protein
MFVAYLKTVSKLVLEITEGNCKNYDRIGKLQVIVEGKTSKIRSRIAKHSIRVMLAFQERTAELKPAHYNRSQTI